MNPLVSIIIPAFNAEKLISETINSVLNQTYKNYEIIIINDGSTDNTLSIVKKYESKKINIIDQENRGQSASENIGLKHSQGELIEFLDSDDLLSPDKIEKQVKKYNKYGNNFVYSCKWARFRKLTNDAVFIPNILWKDIKPVDWLVNAWENNLMMHGASWLIPRKIIDDAGLWDERLTLINDFDFFSRVLLNCDEIKFCKEVKTYYRSGNEDSLSGRKSNEAFKSAFISISLGTENLIKTENSSRTCHASATSFQRFIFASFPQLPELRRKAEEKVKLYGGTDLQPDGGPIFKYLSLLFGWKKAAILRRYAYGFGYKKLRNPKNLF